MKAALPRLAASSAAVVKGSSFEKAKKHAEVSRNLVGIWQRLSKLFGGRLVEAMPTESLQSLQGACTAAHSSEANPKVKLCSYVSFAILDNFEVQGFESGL